MPKFLLSTFIAVREGRFFYLLIVLLGYLLLAPFLKGFIGLQLIYSLFLMAVLLASIMAIRSNRRQTVAAVCLAIPMTLTIWMEYARPTLGWRLSADTITLLFLAYIIVLLLQFVFTTREVTRHVIFGAVSVYLLIGILWSIVYAVLETLAPGSFSQVPVPGMPPPSFFVYFSFVTITTLGYGDITPLTAKAQSLAVAEALVGQIYMTVLIAWLVGLYVSRKTR